MHVDQIVSICRDLNAHVFYCLPRAVEVQLQYSVLTVYESHKSKHMFVEYNNNNYLHFDDKMRTNPNRIDNILNTVLIRYTLNE